MKIVIARCLIKPVSMPWIEWVASHDGFQDTGDDGLGVTIAEAVVDLLNVFRSDRIRTFGDTVRFAKVSSAGGQCVRT